MKLGIEKLMPRTTDFKNHSFVEPPSDTLLHVKVFHPVPSPSTLDVIFIIPLLMYLK